MAFFKGFYFKQQNSDEVVALIPAIHSDGNVEKSASIQILTRENSYFVPYRAEEVGLYDQAGAIAIGSSVFTKNAVYLHMNSQDVLASGELHFSGMTPLAYDIMGPFKLMPNLECRHMILSMRHNVRGNLVINGNHYVFCDGIGYLEGDRGRSFPQTYFWCHCAETNPSCSISIAVAKVPVAGIELEGVIAVVQIGEKEYRLATYLGARVYSGRHFVLLKQGNRRLKVEFGKLFGQELHAPVAGQMTRRIREGICCEASFLFAEGENCLLDFTTQRASIERVLS
ncbi:MAG: hypothetical protein IJL39_00895 [Clostridia bacterium]|nr:hypothetical protein [Clostridia bacterium]